MVGRPPATDRQRRSRRAEGEDSLGAHGAVDGHPARRRIPPRLCAGGVQSQRLRRGHDPAQCRWQLGVPHHSLLSRLSRLRLGHPGGLGVGSVARGGLPGARSGDRCQEIDHHGRVAQRQIVHGRGGVRRALDGRAGGHGRRRHRRLPVRRTAEERNAGHHAEEVSQLVFAEPARVLGPAREAAVR